MHFEALLGLTNLASVDDATKNRITSEKGGVRALEYVAGPAPASATHLWSQL